MSRNRSAHAAAVLSVAGASLAVAAGQVFAESWRPHAPAAAWLRAAMGIVWTLIQTGMIAAVYQGSHRRFAAMLLLGMTAGLTVMTLGRSGASATAWMAAGLLVPSVLVLAPSAGHLSRLARTTCGDQEVRFVLVLSGVGFVYLYSARVADGVAQLSAVGAASFLLAMTAAAKDRLARVLLFLEHRDAQRVGMILWGAAMGLLVVNLAAQRISGAVTPQIGPVAPYQVAAVLIVIAAAFVHEGFRSSSGRGVLANAIGLGTCLVLMAKADGGTLALVLFSVAFLVAVLGRRETPAMITVAFVVALALARSPIVPALASKVSERWATRLAGWSGQAPVNDQMARVHETISMAGVTGHAGAARPAFLIGPAVGKDYMASLIAAQGGIVGLLIAAAAILLFLVALMRRVHRVEGAVARAVSAAVFSLFSANTLITLLWMNDTIPLLGIPAPMLARAGSHLTVAALAVGAVSFGTRVRGHVHAQA